MSLFPCPAPPLPPFSSLLITGPSHPSAPIHLAFSSAGPKSPVLLLCPSRDLLKDELLRFNDSWLNSQSGTGSNMALASHVSIFYPPTPVHLSLLLSMFHVPRPDGPRADLNEKTALAIAPSLIILVDPSRYFLEDVPNTSPNAPTLSSYLTLINRVFASISNFTNGATSPKFALFDSHLDSLRLPLISTPSLLEDEQPLPEQLEPMAVLPALENLFEWIGIFSDDDPYIPSSQGEEEEEETTPEEGTRKQLRLYHPDGDVDERLYHWVERRGPISKRSISDETEFVWEDQAHAS